MTGSHILTVAETQGRDLLRRRVALAMLVLLPAAMYLTVSGEESIIEPGGEPFPLKVGVIGVAWTIAGAAFFLGLSSRHVDERLILAGYRRVDLALGRLLFLSGVALPMVAVSSLLITTLSRGDSGPIVLAVVCSAGVALGLGLALAAIIPRELEGALALIAVVGVQISLPSDSAIAVAMPFYGPTQLAGVAWSGAGPVASSVGHSGVAVAVLLGVFGTLWGRRPG